LGGLSYQADGILEHSVTVVRARTVAHLGRWGDPKAEPRHSAAGSAPYVDAWRLVAIGRIVFGQTPWQLGPVRLALGLGSERIF
jgi:hypothetical protein